MAMNFSTATKISTCRKTVVPISLTSCHNLRNVLPIEEDPTTKWTTGQIWCNRSVERIRPTIDWSSIPIVMELVWCGQWKEVLRTNIIDIKVVCMWNSRCRNQSRPCWKNMTWIRANCYQHKSQDLPAGIRIQSLITNLIIRWIWTLVSNHKLSYWIRQ